MRASRCSILVYSLEGVDEVSMFTCPRNVLSPIEKPRPQTIRDALMLSPIYKWPVVVHSSCRGVSGRNGEEQQVCRVISYFGLFLKPS